MISLRTKSGYIVKPIPGFDKYFADTDGFIWSTNVMLVHRLILLTFVGVCPKNMVACHNNGNSKDNNWTNLRWDTPQNNVIDQIKHGTHRPPCLKGEKCGRSKLNELQVRIIRRYPRYRGAGVYLAKLFNITGTQISYILNRKSWAWLCQEHFNKLVLEQLQ